jgi:hypothetical protein
VVEAIARAWKKVADDVVLGTMSLAAIDAAEEITRYIYRNVTLNLMGIGF